jgi:hypothetical protein
MFNGRQSVSIFLGHYQSRLRERIDERGASQFFGNNPLDTGTNRSSIEFQINTA